VVFVFSKAVVPMNSKPSLIIITIKKKQKYLTTELIYHTVATYSVHNNFICFENILPCCP